LPQICAVLYDIDVLRCEIDGLDATILAAVKRRAGVSQAVAPARRFGFLGAAARPR
jgi:chorismate mutase